MRILLVSHPPLTAELGAAQIALRLAAELRTLGHDAVAWSPAPLPAGTHWRNLWLRQRRAIERHVAEHGPFDVIDTPAISASPRLACAGRLAVRSIQPELLYLWSDVQGDLRQGPVPSSGAVARTVWAVPRVFAIVGGWRRAATILCLGSRERNWMRRRFPAWSAKTGVYVCAPSQEEREALLDVRRRRPDHPPGPGLRFLWIGRWAAHKGTRRLLDFLSERLSDCPADTVTLAGCGPAAERDLPSAWLRAERVRLVPSFTRAELPALLAGHDAGLFTSSVEGWGLSLNEMLEAGLMVFATPAGAVDDLQPYFPASLRPFPPPERPEPAPREDLAVNGYFERFNWSAIARDYARQALLGDV
jgi:glycosyltransferase involved in cell wall biosynthesis